MNNPDEETAVAQFGKGDKYFGICTLLVTMPGLPMFGHGQIEGFEEKYGMEYRRAYRDERPDGYLVDRHEREIFPLMKKRHIFSGSNGFRLYDFYSSEGRVNENVFAYSNRNWDDRALVLYNNSYYESSGWIRQSSPAIPQEDGSLRQDTLTEALSIHGEDRYFSLFHEQRSGLWFIRSSKDLSERGLFVSLRGYESQVFLDIHEREDGIGGPWSRRWSRLNYELNGRGAPDPDAAVADLFLDAIYRPFAEILSPQRVEALEAAVESANSGALASLLKEFTAPILDFTEAAVKFLDGADGSYEPFAYPGLAPSPGGPVTAETACVHEDGNAAAASLGTTASGLGTAASSLGTTAASLGTAAAAAGALAQFSGFLERLIGTKIGPVAEALRPLGTGDAGERTDGEAGTAEAAFLREFTACALGYGTLALLRVIVGPSGKAALALLNHWQLDRKLKECFRGLGLDSKSWRIAETMKALLDRTCTAMVAGAGLGDGTLTSATGAAVTETAKGHQTGKAKTAKVKTTGKATPIQAGTSAGAWASVLIAENYQAEDFRRLLGMNHFNDVTWFNKEAFEESLVYLSCFLLVEDEAALGPAFAAAAGTAERTAFITEFNRVLLKAEENSGYRLDELIRALAGDL
jgi:hypothetical protein